MNRGLRHDYLIYVSKKGWTSSNQDINYLLIWLEIWRIRTGVKVPEDVEIEGNLAHTWTEIWRIIWYIFRAGLWRVVCRCESHSRSVNIRVVMKNKCKSKNLGWRSDLGFYPNRIRFKLVKYIRGMDWYLSGCISHKTEIFFL